jgi:hypothetical protein
MTDMDKIQKDNAEPGKAPDKMSADKLHLFATQYAFIDGRLHEAEQAMLKFMLEFLAQYGRVSLGLTEEEELDDNNFDNPVREARHVPYQAYRCLPDG